MEWFSGIFTQWADGSETVFLHTYLLIIAQSVGLILLFRRKINLYFMAGFSIFAVLAHSFLLTGSPPLGSFGFLPFRLRNFSTETLLIISGWVTGFVLMLYSLSKKKRSLQRVIASISLIMMCSLMYGYHLLIIQGSMKSSMAIEERLMLKVIGLPSPEWLYQCDLYGYYCSSGNQGDEVSHTESLIKKQLNDYVGHYRGLNLNSFVFSMSRGLVVNKMPFSAAFLEGDSGYRLMVERRSATTYFNIAQNSFNLMANLAMAFWFFGGLLVVFLHQFAMRSRNHLLTI